MGATLLLRTRIIYSEVAFAELVLWRVSAALQGSKHAYKYRLAYMVGGRCVLRVDNALARPPAWQSSTPASAPHLWTLSVM